MVVRGGRLETVSTRYNNLRPSRPIHTELVQLIEGDRRLALATTAARHFPDTSSRGRSNACDAPSVVRCVRTHWQLITLYITPVIYTYLDGLNRGVEKRLARKEDEQTGEAGRAVAILR